MNVETPASLGVVPSSVAGIELFFNPISVISGMMTSILAYRKPVHQCKKNRFIAICIFLLMKFSAGGIL